MRRPAPWLHDCQLSTLPRPRTHKRASAHRPRNEPELTDTRSDCALAGDPKLPRLAAVEVRLDRRIVVVAVDALDLTPAPHVLPENG